MQEYICDVSRPMAFGKQRTVSESQNNSNSQFPSISLVNGGTIDSTIIPVISDKSVLH